MARSNSSQDRTAAQPTYPPARASAPVEHGLPWNAAGSQAASYPQDPQFAAPAYDPQPTGRPHPGPTGQLPWPQQGAPAAGQPNAYPPQYQALPPPQANGSGGPYAQQPGYPQHAYPPQQPFPADPHRGHYFPQQQPDPASAYQTPAPPYQDPAQQLRGSYPGHVEQGYAAPAQQMGGYPPAGYQNAPPNTVGHDPRGYEFGAYATAPVAYADPHTGRPHQPTQPGQPHYDPHAQPHAAEAFDDDEEEFDDEEEDAPRRFGLLKILASLTIAIGIGAGGAYGYKKFGATPVAGNRPMAVRADAAPNKQRSAEANLAANADSKSGERLGEQIPAVVPANDGSGDNGAPAGARRVQTIAIAPPGTQVSQPQTSMRPTISVPGLALDGLPMGQGPQASAPAALPPVTLAPAGRAVAAPPLQPQRAPIAPKVIASLDDPTAGKPAPAMKMAVAKIAPLKAVKSADAYSPGGTPSAIGGPAAVAGVTATPAIPTKAATNGYVAVLASQSSAIDARKTLDDLQGKYTDVLGGKPTDVTEFANPRDGKTYYRAIVGPPGSKEAAKSVCAQIKAAGYNDCFTTAY